MNILIPITIADTMIGGGTTVAEPAPGETAWTDTTYSVGARRIRTQTHRVYECVSAIGAATGTPPEDDAVHWLDAGPTQRFAPFDHYTSTAATTTTTLTYVLTPGYFNCIGLYGLTGTQYTLTVKDAPGGSVIYSKTGYLAADPLGWYEYLFISPSTINKLLFTGIPIRPNAEATITITAASGQPVGVGMINVGDYRPLIGDADWGGTVAGASAEPVTYSYIETDEYGNTTIVRRHSATNLRVKVTMPRTSADAALASVQEVLDVPVSWISTDCKGFDGLNVFGLGSGSISYNFSVAEFDITVKGLI